MNRSPVIEDRIPLLDEVLDGWTAVTRDDHRAYRNHVYRMVHFGLALRDCSEEERAKLVIAGCFHDLGIWTEKTLDYLDPSAALAAAYLRRTGREDWVPEVSAMIEWHHRPRPAPEGSSPLVEVFRRGDLVDVSLGLVAEGLPRDYIAAVRTRFPNSGFHRVLLRLGARWFLRHPADPLPFVRW